MSIHDKAATRHARRFSLTVIKYSRGCMQTLEHESLTEREVAEHKALAVECWPYPSLESEYGEYSLSFEVARS